MKEKKMPCPVCNTELVTPREYFSALKRMNEEVGKFREVIIKDYEIGKTQDEVRNVQYWRNIDDELPAESMRDHENQGKNTFPLIVLNPNGDPYFEAFRIARYNYACGKIFAVDLISHGGTSEELPDHKMWMPLPKYKAKQQQKKT